MQPPERFTVLLHGLGRSPRSMRTIERALREIGDSVLNLGYPSRRKSIAALADEVAQRVVAWNPEGPLHFITHSLGGIVLRAAVASGALPAGRVRRAVMLGPPNSGSELADVLPTIPALGAVYRRFTGPAGLELGTGSSGTPGRLPRPDFETGIIAGTRSGNPFFSALLGAASDGKVRVESTKVEGMADFLEVPYWHPWLMMPRPVVAQVVHFLDHGKFRR